MSYLQKHVVLHHNISDFCQFLQTFLTLVSFYNSSDTCRSPDACHSLNCSNTSPNLALKNKHKTIEIQNPKTQKIKNKKFE